MNVDFLHFGGESFDRSNHRCNEGEGGVARGLIDSISKGFHPTFPFVRPCIPVSTRPFLPLPTVGFPYGFRKGRIEGFEVFNEVTGLHLCRFFRSTFFFFSFFCFFFCVLLRRCNSKDSMSSYETTVIR